MIFLGITIVSAILLNKVYQYQTMSIFETDRKGSITTLLGIGLPFALVFGVPNYIN